MRQQRGVLTEEIQKKSKELLGYDLIENELRLMPYIQYIVTNEKRIYRENLNALDKAILEFWVEKGYISVDLNYLPQYRFRKLMGWDFVFPTFIFYPISLNSSIF